MTREEAKKFAINWAQMQIDKFGPDHVFMRAPKRGKNTWTNQEVMDSILNDTPLEGCNDNLIDQIIALDKWAQEHKNNNK